MTEPLTNTEQDSAATESPNEEVAAAIHRRMGTAGVRLNSAHAHLSALRTASGSSGDDVVPTDAELEALVYALEDANQRLTEALNLAIRMADKDQPGSDGSETDPLDGSSQEMLWNTARPHCIPDNDEEYNSE